MNKTMLYACTKTQSKHFRAAVVCLSLNDSPGYRYIKRVDINSTTDESKRTEPVQIRETYPQPLLKNSLKLLLRCLDLLCLISPSSPLNTA